MPARVTGDRQPRLRFTIRWLMTRIAVLAVVFAFLIAADREGRPRGCGTPLSSAITVLLALVMLYVITRIVIFGVQHST